MKKAVFPAIGKTAFAVLRMIAKIKNGILMERLSVVAFADRD